MPISATIISPQNSLPFPKKKQGLYAIKVKVKLALKQFPKILPLSASIPEGISIAILMPLDWFNLSKRDIISLDKGRFKPMPKSESIIKSKLPSKQVLIFIFLIGYSNITRFRFEAHLTE